ncbi:MAG TPA: ParB/RepB/Spo0J family partition protein, partial [Spirochaetota bacterium]|nr:ParB/RepB/Spo0J family partition protein [Spirochaetota bacterium]
MFEADISDVVYDEEYKISRPYNQSLSISIKRSGLASPLILIENGSSFRILSGHNRYKAMRDASIIKFPAVKTVSIHEDFRNEIIKKNYSGLLSFSGKLKACKYFYSDTDLMNELGIPASRRTANDILIPDSILDY